MRRATYFVVGLVIWLLLTWPVADGLVQWQVIIAGIIASAVAAMLFHEILPKEHHVFSSPIRLFWLLVYVPVLFYYIMLANFDVVYRALHPRMPINPGIVKIRTRLKSESGITALANSITLTPGTLTVDLTDDGYLYVHWINVTSTSVEDATQKIAKELEWFLQKIFE